MRQPKRDYYEVLGVPRGAKEEEIRRAFRRLARELHPDVSPATEADARFREVSAAYSVLSKPRSRLLYDHFGYRGRGGGFENGAPVGPARVLAEVELDEYEAARGVRREIQVSDPCEACAGTGAAAGSEPRICETCSGKGTVRVSSRIGVGRWLQVEPCPECGGAGRFQARCEACDGLGEVYGDRTIKVRIPGGVEDGTRLRVAGEPQNAYVVVRLKPTPADSRLVMIAAVLLLASAVALLIYLLVWA